MYKRLHLNIYTTEYKWKYKLGMNYIRLQYKHKNRIVL